MGTLSVLTALLMAAAVVASVRSFVHPLYVKGNFLSLAAAFPAQNKGREEGREERREMLGLGKLGVVRDIEGTATRRGRDGLDPRPADLVAAPPSLILSGSEWRRKLDDGLGAMVTNDLAWPPARRRRDATSTCPCSPSSLPSRRRYIDLLN